MRRLRRVGPRRGRRQADLLRALRPAAPRPGVGRHRRRQRSPDPRLQGHGPGVPGLRRVHPRGAARSRGDRPLALLDDRLERVAQRAADLPLHVVRLDRARPQRQPDEHRRPRQAGRRAGSRPRPARPRHPHLGGVERHRPGHRTAGRLLRPTARAGRRGDLPDDARRLLVRVHGRGHAVRRPRPAGHPAPRPRPARARLGRRLGDGRPRHRRRVVRARGGAGRADRDRRGRPAVAVLREAGAEGLPVRVRLPGPARHADQRPARTDRPRRDRPHAWPASTRSRPTW